MPPLPPPPRMNRYTVWLLHVVVYCTYSLEAYLYPNQEMGLDIQPGSVMRSTIEAIKTVHKVYVGMQVRSYFCSLKPPSLKKNITQIFFS